MYRIRLATGHETVFETVEDIARGVSSGTITTECSVFHAKAKKWLPISVHPLYNRALEVAEQMASRPARPKRVSRPLPRVDTPSPERTSPNRTRVRGPDPEAGDAVPPAEASTSPAANELRNAALEDAGGEERTVLAQSEAETDSSGRDNPSDAVHDFGGEQEPATPPQLNDGLLDLGPIEPGKNPPANELIIERGAPPPDFEPVAPIVTPTVDARIAPERTRRSEPPVQADPPARPPAPESMPRDADKQETTGPASRIDAPHVPPDAKPLKRADGPLPIGAALGDFDDESKVDAMLPPPRKGERRASGAQAAIPAEPIRRAGSVRRGAHDPFSRSEARRSANRTPLLAAAGFGGLIVGAFVLKAFVFGSGTDPVEAATRRDTTATLAATTTDLAAGSGRAVVSTVLDSLRAAAATQTLTEPVVEHDVGVSGYVMAYNAARTDLEISLAGIDVPGLLASGRWASGEGAMASQRELRAIRAALTEFRGKEAEIEATRPEAETSLRETTPQVRRADLMLAALDSLFVWMVSQANQYVLVEDAIIFRGDSTQQATYLELKQRVLNEVYRREPPPPSVAQVIQAIDSTLFPTPSSIPDASSLPAFSLPADSTSSDT